MVVVSLHIPRTKFAKIRRHDSFSKLMFRRSEILPNIHKWIFFSLPHANTEYSKRGMNFPLFLLFNDKRRHEGVEEAKAEEDNMLPRRAVEKGQEDYLRGFLLMKVITCTFLIGNFSPRIRFLFIFFFTPVHIGEDHTHIYAERKNH